MLTWAPGGGEISFSLRKVILLVLRYQLEPVGKTAPAASEVSMRPCPAVHFPACRWAAALLFLILAMGGSQVQAEQPKPVDCPDLRPAGGLRLATGLPQGAYEKFGKSLAEQGRKTHIQVCNTDGSIKNIQILSDDQADLAIVQSDIMLDAWSHAERPKTRKGHEIQERRLHPENISLVRWLFSERLHLLVGPDTGIYSVANLKGKRVWLGPEGSGSRNLALEVLNAAGFGDTDFQDYCPKCLPRQALESLATGEVSALFWTTMVPIPKAFRASASTPETVQDKCNKAWSDVSPIAGLMCEHPEVRLLGLDPNLLYNLTRNPRYVEVVIPRNVYPNQNYAVPTLGVQAMMVTRMAADDARVEEVYELLSSKRKDTERSFGTELDLVNTKLEGESTDILLPHLHAKVSGKLRPSKLLPIIKLLAALAVVAGLSWLFLRPGPGTKAYGTRARVAACLFVLLMLWLGLGLLLFMTERPFSVEYDTFWQASWSVLRHYAQGLQTPTMTPTGREIAFLGLGVLVLFVGWLRSALVDGSLDRLATWLSRRLTRSRANARRSRRVILNWDPSGEGRIKTVLPGGVKAGSLLIVTPRRPAEGLHSAGESVEILEGDPRSRETLEKAQVAFAESVTILTSWQPSDPNDRRLRLDPDVADGFTIMAILAVRALCQGEGVSPWVPITAELRAPRNAEAALRAGQHNVRVVYV